MSELHIYITKQVSEPKSKTLWAIYREDGELLGVRATRKAARNLSAPLEWRAANGVTTPRIVRATLAPRVARPFAYACPANCGCLWRDNDDGTMSLFGPNSHSCRVCEFLPLNKLIPLTALTTDEKGEKDE